MLEALERHPGVRVSLHYSGPLIDWIKKNHKDFFPRVAQLVKRGQVEMIGGGYYEPILPMIPDQDKTGQIRKMSESIFDDFGVKPTGLWLAERVWEPGLPRPLSEAGVEWTLVDDTHFKMVGMEDRDLFGYYLTEEQGCSIKIFPISKYLRYSIPWAVVSEVIDYLKQESSESGARLAVLGDDGEKFGVWPTTFKHCWQDQWVDNFFKALEDNGDWLRTVKLGEYASSHPPAGRVYLPCASYDEMQEWSLPTDKSSEFTELKHRMEDEGRKDVSRYMHGGFWRSFLVKYPEINRMQKRMMQAHRTVYEADWLGADEDIGKDDLWQAQCNCPYWHGVFGGVYLTDIRTVTYRHLIKAEMAAAKALREKVSLAVNYAINEVCKVNRGDFDADGYEELTLDNGKLALYLSPREGGSLFEWDNRQPAHNLLSTLARRPEPYHRALRHQVATSGKQGVASIHDKLRVKESGLSEMLVYDSYPRSSLIEHFIEDTVTLDAFAAGHYQELGGFVNQPYEVVVDSRDKARLKAMASRNADVTLGGQNVPLEVRKELVLEAERDGFRVNYEIRNTGESAVRCLFGSEWNINLLGGGGNPYAYYRLLGVAEDASRLDSQGVTEGIKTVALGNNQLRMEAVVSADRPFRLWRFPVESISNSEGGVERVYQASCLLLLWPLDIAPGVSMRLGLDWMVKAL